MMSRTHFSIILLACFSLYLLNADITNTVYEAQKNTKEVLQNGPRKISGKAKAFIKQTGITFENFLDSKLLLENMRQIQDTHNAARN